jgi:hypothetical protein
MKEWNSYFKESEEQQVIMWSLAYRFTLNYTGLVSKPADNIFSIWNSAREVELSNNRTKLAVYLLEESVQKNLDQVALQDISLLIASGKRFSQNVIYQSSHFAMK